MHPNGVLMNLAPIISKNIRVRAPEDFTIGDGSIVDDFCYFSTKIKVGRFCHIANGVSVGGGRDRLFTLGDYSSISAGVKIWCRSDDFICDMAALVPAGIEIPKKEVVGDVTLASLTIVGSNAVVMPKNDIPEGVAIGALSFVPSGFKFEPWIVYAGIPIRPLKKRDRDAVLRQRDILEEAYREHIE
jgi:acetyltransferase-like isoleucine patch superfamily enzyme